VKFLLDTHVWLWLNSQPEQIVPSTLSQLSHPDSDLYLSAASAWEIAIKCSLGKLQLPAAPELYIPAALARDRVRSLSIELAHTLQAGALPNIHRDPVDRLLVAQAQLLGLCLVKRDNWVQQYPVAWLAA
jgi:PIN domain nuclease of toxin-antitoxin system